MKRLLIKLLVGFLLPIIGSLFEESMKLMLEAINDEGLNNRDKIRYVVQGVTDKLGDIENKL